MTVEAGTQGRARTVARLAHDVGKYVARTASNLPRGHVTEPLLSMLCADLYALDGARPASRVLDELAAPLGEPAGAPIDRCRRALAEVDALEAQVRAGDGPAVHRAATLARRVALELQSLAAAEGRGGA